MSQDFTKVFSLPKRFPSLDESLCGLLVIFHLGLFIFLNNIPIHWQQDEITYHRFFWSKDTPESFTLHTGLTKGDILKPFYAQQIDGVFRPRQVSYYLEMLSFKFIGH